MRSFRLLLLLGLLTFFLGLGRPAISDSDEAFYAEAAKEMVEGGDWLTPHYNFEYRFQKPILYYWLTAAAYEVAGVGEGAARFWSAMSGLGLMLVAWAAARRLYDPTTAWIAGAIVATSFGAFAMARLALPDLALAFVICLAIWSTWRATLDADGRARAWWLLAGLALGLGELPVVDAVDAQRALLHHLLLLVELARAVRAGPRAVLAADALVVIDEHDAVLGALVARAGGTHRHARRVLAVQAGLRKVHRLGVRIFADLEGLHAIEERPRRIRSVRALIGHRAGGAGGVPLLAARDAGVAADANVQVYDQRELGHGERSMSSSRVISACLRNRRGCLCGPASFRAASACRRSAESSPALPARRPWSRARARRTSRPGR